MLHGEDVPEMIFCSALPQGAHTKSKLRCTMSTMSTESCSPLHAKRMRTGKELESAPETLKTLLLRLPYRVSYKSKTSAVDGTLASFMTFKEFMQLMQLVIRDSDVFGKYTDALSEYLHRHEPLNAVQTYLTQQPPHVFGTYEAMQQPPHVFRTCEAMQFAFNPQCVRSYNIYKDTPILKWEAGEISIKVIRSKPSSMRLVGAKDVGQDVYMRRADMANMDDINETGAYFRAGNADLVFVVDRPGEEYEHIGVLKQFCCFHRRGTRMDHLDQAVVQTRGAGVETFHACLSMLRARGLSRAPLCRRKDTTVQMIACMQCSRCSSTLPPMRVKDTDADPCDMAAFLREVTKRVTAHRHTCVSVLHDACC